MKRGIRGVEGVLEAFEDVSGLFKALQGRRIQRSFWEPHDLTQALWRGGLRVISGVFKGVLVNLGVS